MCVCVCQLSIPLSRESESLNVTTDIDQNVKEYLSVLLSTL